MRAEILRGIWVASGVGVGSAALPVPGAPPGSGWMRALRVCSRDRSQGSRSALIWGDDSNWGKGDTREQGRMAGSPPPFGLTYQ